MTICVTIATVLGFYCYENAVPIGECVYADVVYCAADEDDFLIRPSWYDPFIQTDSPAIAEIQCMDPCHLLGDGTPVEDGYDLYVACVPGWYGRWIEIEGIGVRQCRDHGGAIVPTYGRTFYTTETGEIREGWAWWLPVDVLTKQQPHYAYDLLKWGFTEG